MPYFFNSSDMIIILSFVEYKLKLNIVRCMKVMRAKHIAAFKPNQNLI